MVVDLWPALRAQSKIRDLRISDFLKEICSESKILKSRILKWLIMMKKFLLVLESAPEELILIPKILLTLERSIRVMMKLEK